MTGTRISNSGAWLLAVLSAAIIPAAADDIALTGDAALSGTIRSINEAGVVELASELSPEPLLLKAGAVEEVKFSAPQDRPDTPAAMVELVNGDFIPAEIESLDDQKLTVNTPDAGRLLIPRGSLKSLQLGVHKRKIIYAGPNANDDWKGDSDSSRTWKFDSNTLIASGPAFATKNVGVPLQFALKFSVKWQGNPNFQVFFADPLKQRGEVADRYYLQFANAGMELKRESTTGSRFTTVILSPRTPDQFPDNKLDIEIRVDRKTARLHLLLNGEPEGAGVDPVGVPPQGRGISLVSNISNGNEQEISDIQILELDEAGDRHRSEARGDAKTDSMISRDDDRWGGQLTTIKKTGEGLVFLFKSDFQEAPLELMESDVSTVFFAAKSDPPPAGPERPLVLQLHDNGLLHVVSCEFSESTVTAVHPLLGKLNIRRSGVAALRGADSTKKEAPEE